MTTTLKHIHYLRITREIANELSKDPSTKCGSLIVNPYNRIVASGVNGFLPGFDDSDELFANRDFKINNIIHDTMNAILTAQRDLRGCTLYVWPPSPVVTTCHECAKAVITVGITKVVYPYGVYGTFNERWADSCKLAQHFYDKAQVEVIAVPLEHINTI